MHKQNLINNHYIKGGSESVGPSIFSWVTFPVYFIVLISNNRLYGGMCFVCCDVMLAGSQTVLYPLGDGVRRFFDEDSFWKELVVNSRIINGVGNTT